MTDSTFTFGMTPESVIREAFARECPDGTFRMIARGIDEVTLDAAGCCAGYWGVGELLRTLDALSRASLDRELVEYDPRYSSEEIGDNAMSLRTSILSVLGVEEL